MRRRIFSLIVVDRMPSFGLLLFRVMVGSYMLAHGVPKLLTLGEKFHSFPDPLGVGSPISILGTISGEVIAASFIILGFATRLSSVVLGFVMSVAALIVHSDDPFGTKEKSLLYLACCILLFFTGPGRYSIDRLISGKKSLY